MKVKRNRNWLWSTQFICVLLDAEHCDAIGLSLSGSSSSSAEEGDKAVEHQSLTTAERFSIFLLTCMSYWRLVCESIQCYRQQCSPSEFCVWGQNVSLIRFNAHCSRNQCFQRQKRNDSKCQAVSAPTHNSAHQHQVKKGLLLWKLCVYDSLLARCGARAVSTLTGGNCTSSSGVLPSLRAWLRLRI